MADRTLLPIVVELDGRGKIVKSGHKFCLKDLGEL